MRPMTYRVVVWGTGNAGRPAIRAVAAHADLELVGVVVANPEKVGRDAGELACLEPGANVVSTSFYPLLHPASAPAPVIEAVERACARGDTSVFVSGIDPG